MHNDRPTDLTFLIDPFPDSPASGRVTWAEVEALAAVAPPDKNAGRAAAAGRRPHARGPGTRSLASHTDKRIRAYMATVGPAVSNSGGHNKAFETAQALVNGWCLSVPDAMPYYEDWNRTCVPPWSDAELRHKLQDAEAKPCDKPRGWLLDAPGRDDYSATGASDTSPAAAQGQPVEDNSPGVNALEPRHLAETFLKTRYTFAGDPVDYRLTHYEGRYLAWSDGAYRTVKDARMIGKMNLHAEVLADCEYRRKIDEFDGKGHFPLRAGVKRSCSLDALNALESRIMAEDGLVPPCWLDTVQNRPDATKIVPTTRGIIVPSTGEVLPITPALFTLAASPHYHPDANEPLLWMRFLNQVFGGDVASIGTLQEFAGLLLTPDTSYQKFLFLVGKARGGKGTVIRVLTELVGKAFTVPTSFFRLSGEFGTAPLVGKTLATMGEVKTSPRTDVTQGLETLLRIVGEDDVDVNQKQKPIDMCKSAVRFVVAANDVPNIKDNSAALASRAIILKFNFSFAKVQDTKLVPKLCTELPGIFAWAMVGLQRLNERGYFIQPESGDEAMMQFGEAASPLRRFLRSSCIVDPLARVLKGELYAAYEVWATTDRQPLLSPSLFGVKLREASDVTECTSRATDSNARLQFYRGVRLRTTADDEG